MLWSKFENYLKLTFRVSPIPPHTLLRRNYFNFFILKANLSNKQCIICIITNYKNWVYCCHIYIHTQIRSNKWCLCVYNKWIVHMIFFLYIYLVWRTNNVNMKRLWKTHFWIVLRNNRCNNFINIFTDRNYSIIWTYILTSKWFLFFMLPKVKLLVSIIDQKIIAKENDF